MTSNNIQSSAGSVQNHSLGKESGHEYCSNCGVKLAGMYCHHCGQSSKSMIKFFGEVVRELLEDTIGYDSRIKHSIAPLLFKPGRITLDYIKGKRFFYVLPFRLYLITSLLLILLVKGVADTDQLKFDNIVQNNAEQESGEEIKEEVSKELDEALKQVNEIANAKKRSQIEFTPEPDEGENKSNGKTSAPDLGNEDSKGQNNTSLVESPATPKLLTKDSDKQEQSGDGDSINLNWDDERQQLSGVEKMEDSWLKSFLVVINPKIKKWKEDPEPLVDSFFEALPYMMFIILPIFAIFLKLFYAFSKRYYIEHLVFLLHNHAFIYMVLMIEVISEFTADKLNKLDSGMASIVADALDGLATLLFYWMLIYVFLAMKRFYQQGWGATITKTLLLGFIYIMMISFGFMATLAIGAYQA